MWNLPLSGTKGKEEVLGSSFWIVLKAQRDLSMGTG